MTRPRRRRPAGAPRTLAPVLAAVTICLAGSGCGGGSSSPSTTSLTDGTGATDRFGELYRHTLEQQQGLSSGEARCVVDRLEDTLSDAELAALLSGQVSPAASHAAAQASLRCARR